MRSLIAVPREFCGVFERAGDGLGKGIKQQLVCVEVMAGCRVIGAVGTQAIVLAFPDTFDKAVVHIAIALREFVVPDLSVIVEQHHIKMRGRMRPHGDVGTAVF